MSDVDYAMEMFDAIEDLVATGKLLDKPYEEVLGDIASLAIDRSVSGVMDETTALYDSSNIMATFNIIWGE